ncbi:MAG: hypothetical protein HYY92_02910 [Parcubacteria group bacterium]|nr:hypothetical protein [Parcubacteria group bacterium]
MAPLTTPPTTLEEVAKRWPDLLDVETAWMMESLDMALAELHLGEQALLVGHQPLIGLARGSWEPSKGPRFPLYEQTLPKGGIYKFTFVDPPWLELDLNMVECLLPPK